MVCRPDLPVFICVGGRRACPGSQVLFCVCRALFFPLIIQVDLAVDMDGLIRVNGGLVGCVRPCHNNTTMQMGDAAERHS